MRFTFLVDQPLDPTTVTPGNVRVNCTSQTAPAVAEATFAVQTLSVTLAEVLADEDCCEITFNGITTLAEAPLDAVVEVVPLEGDMNFSRSVTGGDALLIKAHFGELAGVDLDHPKWDFDRSGGVTGGDFAMIKTRFGNTAPACP